MGILGDMFEFLLGLGWQLLLLFLALVIGCFVFINLLKLTIWGLILGGITWLIFDSFWIGFVIGIIVTIIIIKNEGLISYLDSAEKNSNSSNCEYTEYEATDDVDAVYHVRDDLDDIPVAPSYESDGWDTRMDDLSNDLSEMEYNLDEVRFKSSEAESERQKFLEYKNQAENALGQAEMEKRSAEDYKEMAERFNDSSYIALMRKCYESSNSYLREAQEKSEQANRCYDRYMQLRAEVEYRRNEASRLNDNIQKRMYYN